MRFRIFITVFNLMIPVTMLFFGIMFRKHGPKNINGIYLMTTIRNTPTSKVGDNGCYVPR